MKEKLYREVKASERLPKSNGSYFINMRQDIGLDVMDFRLRYDPETSPIEDYYNDEETKDMWTNTVDTWLEEIEEVQTVYVECNPSEGEYILRPVDPENTESVLNFVKPLTLPQITEKKIDQVIDDICVLEERIERHYQKDHPSATEIDKLRNRQRNFIKELLNR